jgi:hypothetical protein
VLGSGTLAVAALWGAGALVLPFLVRGRAPALDLPAAAVWAAALAIGTRAITRAAGAGEPRGLVAGAALCALLAVVPALLRARSEGRRGGTP